ncbi:MAG: ribonuclease HII [Firmicutes bacterium]|nr:ribonuclease HII [Bacillota bacterium]
MTKAERLEKMRVRLAEMKEFENKLHAEGVEFVAGVDEVGRGPLAGPVVTAAVVLPADFDVLGVDDSKKLSEKRREELFDVIREKAVAYGIGMRGSERIDEINILEATKEAMADAVAAAESMLAERLGGHIGHVLFDAVKVDAVKLPQTAIIKGDAKSVSIAAASILAKVTRDRMMVEYAKEYPDYAFEKNKGYGTAAHYEGIKKAGMTPIHRRSFLKNLSEH